jgi:hypothetical protein
VTSVGTASALPPAAEISRSRNKILSSLRAASTTAAPLAANARAVASPMPLEAPVTTATLPLKLVFVIVRILHGLAIGDAALVAVRPL